MTCPRSEVCDSKLKEVASTNMEKNINEDQEKVVSQIEFLSPMKQSASDLDHKEIREKQREIISVAQESNYETSGKFLSEQLIQKPTNTKEKRKREKKEIVRGDSVKTCKPAVLSEEQLDQETAIRGDHDSSIKSQPVEIAIIERVKESDREVGFSILCKAEEPSAPVIPKGVSIRNQDTSTFLNPNQVNEREGKNLSLCLTVKPKENLSQEITIGAQSEAFSSMTPRPLNYQESVGKTQIANTSQISKTDKSFQGTTRQETNYREDACITSKTRETKDLILLSNEQKIKSYEEVPFDSTKALKLEGIVDSRVDPKEVRKGSKSDSEIYGILESKMVATKEITGEKFLEMSNPIVTGAEAESFEGIVTQGVPRVLVSLLPEKLFKDVSLKVSIEQQGATISPTIPEANEAKTVPLTYPTMKADEETPPEKLRESPGSEQAPFLTAPRGKGHEGVNTEPSRATKVSFPVLHCV